MQEMYHARGKKSAHPSVPAVSRQGYFGPQSLSTISVDKFVDELPEWGKFPEKCFKNIKLLRF
jgi:hypothetical protein